ncbi:uncharacterized protein PGTG_12946 [Puccinia graminis f. sp. tritici CRL 75-36-700-3]|uniref:NADH dehydrogenase (Ubiquinone) 1 alpha subcomplex 5 n=1 Tax=Puccinia graminis f. sp. tritici (strain CRL 75-36-700-3 / race SCCL) TaxID=418459 RepID=E3KQI9_PUCGT|nr:uncharacterized protein PGTG_12946 [Puccinia graminis f. sp. tritici CRL 75-36-700-3]EFP86564.1 hypothetical protein PGTG_12946 [Puccinia graminis f. sp. tritici CRL 75-36-700-3]
MPFSLSTAARRSRSLISASSQSISGSHLLHHSSTLIRAKYASSVSQSPPAFEVPKTEREVADMLAKAGSNEERKRIFDALKGVQEVAAKVPPKARGPAGVHLIPIGRTKLTTNQTGVDVHHSPFESLSKTYQDTLKALEKIPASTVYRQAVHSTTRNNLEIIKKYLSAAVPGETADAVEQRVKAAENELGVEMIEKAIEQAEDEHQLVLKMIEYKAWQELEEKPAPGQWDYFEIPASTSYPKN